MNLKLFFAVAIFAVFCVAGTAFAMTDQERQALIQQIQRQIAQLQAQIIQLQNITLTPSGSSGAADSTAACAGVTFTRNLTIGSTGSEVRCLQVILNQSVSTQVATTGAGSPGAETTYFGTKTLAAVKVYQVAQGLTPANQVGPLTNQTLNASLAGSSTTTTTTTPTQTPTPTPTPTPTLTPTPTQTSTPTTTPFSCSPNWSCGSWSACSKGQQTKTCADSNGCGTTTGKPVTTQSCTTGTICTPNWRCAAWSTCINSQQTRLCNDSNHCWAATEFSEIQSCTPTASTACTPNWQCTFWSACAGNYQSRTCTDSNKCGTTTGKPVTTQSCTSGTACTPDWQCNSWTTCSDGQQTRICTDLNGCGAFTTRPSQWQYCTPACIPNWQCGTWSACMSNQQTRICTDSNSCGVTSGKPAETQYCSINTCQNINIPGVAFSCVYGTAPYGVSGFRISYSEYSSWVSTFGSQYTPQRDCGCGWFGQTDTTWIRWGSCSSGPNCDSSKVPNELPRRTFTGYCQDSSEVDAVEWSSRLAKGEPYEQAYQNTIENQKRIMMISNEKNCVQEKVY